MKTPRTDEAWRKYYDDEGDEMDMKELMSALEIETQELEAALREINTTLSIPAAEYVPAIREVFAIIDRVLARHAR